MKRQRTLEADIIKALREENAKLTHAINCLTDYNDELLRHEFGETIMPKTVEHIHWPDAPDLWMPYAPAIKVAGASAEEASWEEKEASWRPASTRSAY